MKILALIALGGAFGALGRYGLGFWIQQKMGYGFPYGTLFVNVVGSFVIGILYVILEEKRIYSPEIIADIRAVLVIGLLGALTTFSTFSLDTIRLLEAGQLFKAILNVFVNLTCCFLVTALAIKAGRLI